LETEEGEALETEEGEALETEEGEALGAEAWAGVHKSSNVPVANKASIVEELSGSPQATHPAAYNPMAAHCQPSIGKACGLFCEDSECSVVIAVAKNARCDAWL